MKKILCAALAAVMVGSLAVGCGEKKETSGQAESSDVNMLGGFNDNNNVNISAEDMPYGSNMCELSHEYDERITYKTCYDSRYFVNADADHQDFSEIYRLHDFVAALNTKDVELFKSLYYPGYLEYICEQNNLESIEVYFENLYKAFATELGEDFEINYICASNCYDETDETAASYFERTEEKIAAVDSGAVDKITSRKAVEIGGDTCFKNENGTYLLTDYIVPIALALYEIDGEIYLF